MTPNRSLSLTIQLRALMRQDLLSVLAPVFPFEVIERYTSTSQRRSRDRVYNAENTLLTMVLSATQEDRSLQHAVNLYSEIHRRNAERMKQASRRRARVKPLAASKLKPVSENTAGFSKARSRIDPELVTAVLWASGAFATQKESLWHDMEVYITDGTYFQTQDTPALRAVYKVEDKHGKQFSSFPQGLLQAVVKQSTGAVTDVRLGSRHVSELELVWPMLESLPPGGVLLADDYYCTFAIFARMQAIGAHIIVPGKRKRAYEVIEHLGEGDDIVELRRRKWPPWLARDVELPKRLRVRRIQIADWVYYTTIMDPAISPAEIAILHYTRWDIEITVREIKTLMGMNVARSKTPEMVEKEFKTAIIAYNLMRRVIAETEAQTTRESGFPPEEDLIQEFYEIDSSLLRDKKGRVYHRWSPGRPRRTDPQNPATHGPASTRTKVSKKEQRTQIQEV